MSIYHAHMRVIILRVTCTLRIFAAFTEFLVADGWETGNLIVCLATLDEIGDHPHESHDETRKAKCVPIARVSSPDLEMNVCPLTARLR